MTRSSVTCLETRQPLTAGRSRHRSRRPRHRSARATSPARARRSRSNLAVSNGKRAVWISTTCRRPAVKGQRKNAMGFLETWRDYKLPLDTADCGVPLSATLTSASIHDSQVAILLAVMTAGRVTNLCDLLDPAYDTREIHQMSESLGHVAIIDVNPGQDKDLKEERRSGVRPAMSIPGACVPGSAAVSKGPTPGSRTSSAGAMFVSGGTRRSPAISCSASLP